MINNRYEISFKNHDNLISKLEFLESRKIDKINIPCKSYLKKGDLITALKTIRINFPKFNIITHYSLSYQYQRNVYESYNLLNNSLNEFKNIGINQILLISGSSPKKKFQILDILEPLNNNKLRSSFKIGVAYNPYLPNDLQEHERLRLIHKIKKGAIDSIWLQFGIDKDRLCREIEFINKSLKKFCIDGKDVDLYGSLLIPSRKFSAQFRFRPWKGIYLTENYLNSQAIAKNLTRSIHKVYENYDLCTLIETDICSAKSLDACSDLLKG